MTQYLWMLKKKKCGLLDKDLSSLNHLPLLLSKKIMSHFLTLSSKKKKSGWLLKSNRMVHLHRWEENTTEKNIWNEDECMKLMK